MKKLICIALLFFVSCKAQKQSSSEEEKTYILIDGNHVEMVADEFGNQYLKQFISDQPVYIPFPFETEEESDSLLMFKAKIPTDNDPRRL